LLFLGPSPIVVLILLLALFLLLFSLYLRFYRSPPLSPPHLLPRPGLHHKLLRVLAPTRQTSSLHAPLRPSHSVIIRAHKVPPCPLAEHLQVGSLGVVFGSREAGEVEDRLVGGHLWDKEVVEELGAESVSDELLVPAGGRRGRRLGRGE